MLQCTVPRMMKLIFFIINIDFFVRNWVLLHMNENTKRSANSILMLYIHFPLSFPDTLLQIVKANC